MRPRAGASAAAGAAIGLALATGVLPQVATALNPSGWGTVAVAAFVALFVATVQQWITRTHSSPSGAEDDGEVEEEAQDGGTNDRSQDETGPGNGGGGAGAVDETPVPLLLQGAGYFTVAAAGTVAVYVAVTQLTSARWPAPTLAAVALVVLLAVAVKQNTRHKLTRWFWPCFAGLSLVAVATVVLYSVTPRLLRKPRSVPDQITAQLNTLLDHGHNSVVVNERLRLHPTDEPSWVVVIENARNHSQFEQQTERGGVPKRDPPISDELRIYDVEDGWLTLEVDYRPKGRGLTAREWVTPADAPREFDYSDNGFPDIIAGYARPDAHDELLPIAIDWTGTSYAIRSMTTPKATGTRPSLLPVTPELHPRESRAARQKALEDARTLSLDRRSLYLTPVTLQNAVAGSDGRPSLSGYQMQAFALVRDPSVRLVSGYYAGHAPPTYAEPQVLDMQPYRISPSTLQLEPCGYQDAFCGASNDVEQDVHVPASMYLDNALLDAWKDDRRHWAPTVRVNGHCWSALDGKRERKCPPTSN